MPSGVIDLKSFAGLVTAPGMLERADASFVEAFNVEFPTPGLITKRRGFAQQPGNAGGAVWKLLTSRLLGNNMLAHIGGTGLGATHMRYGDGSGALTSLSMVDGGNLTRARDPRMQGAVSQRNHYVTADEGVARIESDIGSSPIRFAGMPRGLATPQDFDDIKLVAGTALADGRARAYRVTLARKDADGVVMQGAPTARFVAANRSYVTGYTGAARAVELTLQLPLEFGTSDTDLDTTYYLQLWATRTYAEATQVGDDELYLVMERYLTSGEITAGELVYEDNTPDDFLTGAPLLHTNAYNFPPLERGIRQGVVNESAPPPVANDVAYWQDVMWYADYQYRLRCVVNMIALIDDDESVVVTTDFGTATAFAKNSPLGPDDFQITSTSPTTAIDIRETVRCMCGALNNISKRDKLGFSVHPISTTTTQPGLVYVELTRPGTLLSFASTQTAVWAGEGGYEFGGAVDAEPGTNALAFSKPLRADAVPPINSLTAGPADSRILRIIPFRDRLIVFTDVGIYQVTGSTFADFAVSLFDGTFRLMGRELVTVCDDRIYAWCREGIIELDDSGARVVSMPIEATLTSLLLDTGGGDLQEGRQGLMELGFAVGYRERHQVRFHWPEAYRPEINGCATWLTFDTRTRTWARGGFTGLVDGYLDARACGVVRFDDDLLAMGNWSSGGDTYLFLERQAFSSADYEDDMPDGSKTVVESTLTTQWQLVGQRGSQHWQQSVVSWDAGDTSWATLPTAVGVLWATEAGSGSVVSAPVALVTREEPPVAVRRGNRLRLTIEHTTSEYMGIVGLSQSFASGSKYARTVTP